MAIVETIQTEAGYEFRLKTIEGYPARLWVDRQPEPMVYSAVVEVGLYRDRTARAAALAKAFARQMEAFAKKRKIGD
jgi:hypothetical protein